MKYVHGTDEKAHDLLMIWVNRLIFVFVLPFSLLFLLLIIPILDGVFNGDAEAIFYLTFFIICLPLILYGFCLGIWYNSRYYLDEDGITFVYPLHSKKYLWSTFQRVYISPLLRGGSGVKYDYIILMISECGALSRIVRIDYCLPYQSKFLVIRKTEGRVCEFSKFCTFSDPPDIKPYQYPD